MPIKDTKQWFNIAVPHPTKDNQRVQLGCHLEEFLELLETVAIVNQHELLQQLKKNLSDLSHSLKKDPESFVIILDRKEYLDAIADQIVTGTGCAHVQGMDILGALGEVNSSNFSKFRDTDPPTPYFNEHGKISKGPNFREPNLTKFLGTDPTA